MKERQKLRSGQFHYNVKENENIITCRLDVTLFEDRFHRLHR